MLCPNRPHFTQRKIRIRDSETASARGVPQKGQAPVPICSLVPLNVLFTGSMLRWPTASGYNGIRVRKRHTRQVIERTSQFPDEGGVPPAMVRHTPPEEDLARWVSRWVSEPDGNRGTLVRREIWIKRKTIGRWPIDDEIRWVEQRLRERLLFRDGLLREEVAARLEKSLGSIPEAEELQIWLYREKRGLSWNKIAHEMFPSTKGMSARMISDAISQVRRDHRKVERVFSAWGRSHKDTPSGASGGP